MMVIKLKLNLSFITLRVVIITAKFICCEIISHVFAYLKSQKFTQLVTVKKTNHSQNSSIGCYSCNTWYTINC